MDLVTLKWAHFQISFVTVIITKKHEKKCLLTIALKQIKNITEM